MLVVWSSLLGINLLGGCLASLGIAGCEVDVAVVLEY